MVTERYPLTEEIMNYAKIRFPGEFFCTPGPFFSSKNKNINKAPKEVTK